MAAPNLSREQLRALGILPLAFFSAQAIHYWQIEELGHMLWMCNLGNLMLALGLFFEQALLIRVAVIWMIPGIAVWFLYYVVPTWGLYLSGRFGYVQLFGILSSSLVHLGGLSVGLVVLRRVRMDARAWFYAFVWYFVLQLISRLVTPAAMNVNVSHSIPPSWEQTFSTYLRFWFVLSAVVGICLWALGRLLRTIWPEPASVEDSDPIR